jgi:ubiquinone/menaquinone biosynthesis C-methylase UbiE
MAEKMLALARVLAGLPILLILLHTTIRIVRHFYKFPMPQFLANVIDNPLRRKLHPPDRTAIRHGIEPGMVVLEVGPGSGTYTIAAAQRVGDSGRVITVDIEPKIIERVQERIREQGIKNIVARVADVYALPFEDGFFDMVYMITVIGEIPAPDKAMIEFHRVLAPAGALVFSEVLADPDYPRAKTLIRKANAAGFRLKKKVGSLFYYTLILEKTPDGEGA